eukprot:g68107.t1
MILDRYSILSALTYLLVLGPMQVTAAHSHDSPSLESFFAFPIRAEMRGHVLNVGGDACERVVYAETLVGVSNLFGLDSCLGWGTIVQLTIFSMDDGTALTGLAMATGHQVGRPGSEVWFSCGPSTGANPTHQALPALSRTCHLFWPAGVGATPKLKFYSQGWELAAVGSAGEETIVLVSSRSGPGATISVLGMCKEE